MLRINCRSDEGRSRILELEGRLSGPWVDELDRVVSAARSGGEGVTLDLSGLAFADARGVVVLRSLAETGIQMRGCSLFLAELLDGAAR